MNNNEKNVKTPVSVGDIYSKGMRNWDDNEFDHVSNYSSWQSNLLMPFIGKSIIEIGAGQGRITAILSRKLKYVRYLAQEPSSAFFSELSNDFKNIEISNSTVEELSSSLPNSFDTAICVHVLEHIENDIQFVKDVSKMLINNGKILILVPAIQFLMSDLDRNIGHYRRYNIKMFKNIATELNLEILTCRYDNFIGILGWLWFCKIRKVHYQSSEKKIKFKSVFNIFDKYVLPVFSKIEKIIHPPVGLNLLVVLRPRNSASGKNSN